VAGWHEPVLVREVVEALVHRPDGVYLDGTVGTGGHAEAILSVLAPAGRLVCLDQDPDPLAVARERLGDRGERVRFYRGSFSELDRVLAAESLAAFDGILLDLGLNSWSLAQPGKGLSYQLDGPLTMDLDPDLGRDAAQLLAEADEDELVRLFAEYGEVRRPRLYAQRLLRAREHRPLRTTGDLVRALLARPGDPGPAEMSRLFQAIRVETNHEMERLDRFLERAADWVAPGGRLVILSYASHEERRAKGLARRGEGTPEAFLPLLRTPTRPGDDEVRRNRRARSARMRCFQRRGA
jgi:16S rRNA (cytosine1402-N4)-methyltransferase